MNVKRKIILEELLESFDINEILLNKRFSYEDEIYLRKAMLLPLRTFQEALFVYDNTRPKMDELKFIDSLAIVYGVDKKVILERIKEARKIERYKREETKNLKR